ncbi:MAG: Mu-like prophage major head subunit gpT family protein [Thiotrichaceae bacterium]|nr:Mu-like prophage major head subunit gpT family protein [Thiotrichaceae bacterium]
MKLTSSAMQILNDGFNAAWQEGLNAALPIQKYQKVGTKLNSSKRAERMGWLKNLPGFRKWVGERVINNLSKEDYQTVHEPFEHTFGVSQEDFEDDNYGDVATSITMQAQYAVTLPDELLWEKILAGFDNSEGLAYDGQYFFDNDHVGYAKRTGKEISYSNTQAGSSPPWFLADTRFQKTPGVAIFERVAPEFTQLTKPTDENVFMHGELLWGARARYSAAYGFYQKMFGSQAPLIADNLEAAMLAMSLQHRPDGKPLAISATLLIHGPSLNAAVNKLINCDKLDNGASNPNFKILPTMMVEHLG